jgi:hypothetical protein
MTDKADPKTGAQRAIRERDPKAWATGSDGTKNRTARPDERNRNQKNYLERRHSKIPSSALTVRSLCS